MICDHTFSPVIASTVLKSTCTHHRRRPDALGVWRAAKEPE